MRRKFCSISYSYTLLVVALLHASVWSIGVCESHSRQFFLREHDNIQAAAGSNPTSLLNGLFRHHQNLATSLERVLSLSRDKLRAVAREREELDSSQQPVASSQKAAKRLEAARSDLARASGGHSQAAQGGAQFIAVGSSSKGSKPAAAAAAAAAATATATATTASA